MCAVGCGCGFFERKQPSASGTLACANWLQSFGEPSRGILQGPMAISICLWRVIMLGQQPDYRWKMGFRQGEREKKRERDEKAEISVAKLNVCEHHFIQI